MCYLCWLWISSITLHVFLPIKLFSQPCAHQQSREPNTPVCVSFPDSLFLSSHLAGCRFIKTHCPVWANLAMKSVTKSRRAPRCTRISSSAADRRQVCWFTRFCMLMRPILDLGLVHIAKTVIQNVRRDLHRVLNMPRNPTFLMSIYLSINKRNWMDSILKSAYHAGIKGSQRWMMRNLNKGCDQV